jgi:hypothetical protein
MSAVYGFQRPVNAERIAAGGALFSTLTNGGMVFGLFSVAFIGGWIEQFGAFLSNQTAINIGIIASLLPPPSRSGARQLTKCIHLWWLPRAFHPFPRTRCPTR